MSGPGALGMLALKSTLAAGGANAYVSVNTVRGS